jgi:hypothetical protein
MNAIINHHFDAVEMRLLQSSVIVMYEILSREVSLVDGKLRIKATLCNNEMLEFFEYDTETNGELHSVKYSFHWQDAQGVLKKRWDNAPHYLHLPNAPHHVHIEDGRVEEVTAAPDAFFVIGEIEQIFDTQKQ